MDDVAELEARVRRYRADRYPVQRATALFHLGSLLTDANAARAAAALHESIDLFLEAGLALEAAKARNALGAALREAREADSAATEFDAAARAFASLGAEREQAAALFNLGLVTRAPAPIERARDLFGEQGARREEAAAERELGTVLLAAGETQRAAAALERARKGGDPGAPNALGLARLAAGNAQEAADLFREAAALHPRSVRPAEHAMAKANLALALEVTGDTARARLAARQALAVAAAPAPVSEQAATILERLGSERGDLARVLGEDSPECAAVAARDEVARWVDAGAEEREAEAAAWDGDDDAAETLLGTLLELPPEQFELVLDALLPLRAQLERVAPRFHLPQELRVRETLERLWSTRTT